MATRAITFVTGNVNKLREVEAILSTAAHLKITHEALDCWYHHAPAASYLSLC